MSELPFLVSLCLRELRRDRIGLGDGGLMGAVRFGAGVGVTKSLYHVARAGALDSKDAIAVLASRTAAADFAGTRGV